MEKQKRRRPTPEQKAEAIRRHHMGKEAVSAICTDLDIAPNQFYRWQKEMFDHAAAAFEVKRPGARQKSAADKLNSKVDELEERLRIKDNVIAEIAEECVILKKRSGPS